MTPIDPETVLSRLRWRYATKRFDSTKKIPDDLWARLEDAIVLSPSSYGLQPWKFFVVNDPAVRAKLLPATWGQRQIVDASHLVVFCVKRDVGAADAERLIARTADVRGIPAGSLDAYKNLMIGSLSRNTPEAIREWMSRQVFIALGQFLTACALVGVDTCPMEGFQPDQYDEILNLSERGYHSIVLATAGYRAADDPNATLKKVRFEKSEMIEQI
jgi:nitroreductase